MHAKTAFVASGGGLRAFAFHTGAMRALEEHGFVRKRKDAERKDADPKLIGSYIGSSAGACFAVAATFFDSLDDIEAIIGLRRGGRVRFGRRALFRPDLGWLDGSRRPSGLFYASGIRDVVREIVGERDDFRRIGPELYVCATQLNGPRKVVFGPRDSGDGGYNRFIAYYNDVSISDAVAASASVPLLFRPYRIVNKQSGATFEYTDGEVRETLSVHVARDTQVELTIVSNTWMPYYYQREVGSISDRGLFAVLRQTVSQVIEQKIDRFRYETDRYRETFEAIREFARWEKLSDDQLDNLLGQVSLTLSYRPIDEIYIAPDPNDADFCLMPTFSFDPKTLGRALETGYRRAVLAIEKWRAKI